jgi:hypothetical protein
VKNFKSIKGLEIDCRKINLFIGEPNTGKSNILEALGLLSWCGHYTESRSPLKKYVRFEYMQNLFYDNSTEYPIGIRVGDIGIGLEVRFEDDHFYLQFDGDLAVPKCNSLVRFSSLDYSGNLSLPAIQKPVSELAFIKLYRFEEKQDNFPESGSSSLMPPHGSNMFTLVTGSKKLREAMSAFFRDFGYKLMLRTEVRAFEFLKEIDDVIFNYPYVLASDTLQRMIFYTVAMESNEN